MSYHGLDWSRTMRTPESGALLLIFDLNSHITVSLCRFTRASTRVHAPSRVFTRVHACRCKFWSIWTVWGLRSLAMMVFGSRITPCLDICALLIDLRWPKLSVVLVVTNCTWGKRIVQNGKFIIVFRVNMWQSIIEFYNPLPVSEVPAVPVVPGVPASETEPPPLNK